MASHLPLSHLAAPPKPSPTSIAVLPNGLPPSAQIPTRSGLILCQATILSPLCRGVSDAGRPVWLREILPVRWAVSLDFGVAAAHSATLLHVLTADCTQSASTDNGPAAPTSSTTAMPTLPGTCTGLRLCDTSRLPKRVHTCISVFTSTTSSTMF
ncbi:hypothetical protein VPH35_044720 [Triticum aestivum]